jgi:quercetin dioxygenase-like cupin family protein
VVLPCPDLDRAVEFLVGQLGFRLDRIYPADRPRVAGLSGHGLRLRLEQGRDPEPEGTPGRTGFVLCRPDETGWQTGRAGMQYRDLIPGRQGGRLIASHIRISDGGPVPDYVHFHKIRFQLIYCLRGWVRVVYQDQGPPFVMEAGDCVLQPPEIRHRVLEASPGLEVIEISAPAEHETWVDHDMELPTPIPHPEREFGGQRFHRHRGGTASWSDGRGDGLAVRDTGIAAASGGLVSARVFRSVEGAVTDRMSRGPGLRVLVVLAGSVHLHRASEEVDLLGAGEAVVIPPEPACRLQEASGDLELLEVTVP